MKSGARKGSAFLFGQSLSDVTRLCGAENIFWNLLVLVPSVSLESVLEADPEVIIASGEGYGRPA